MRFGKDWRLVGIWDICVRYLGYRAGILVLAWIGVPGFCDAQQVFGGVEGIMVRRGEYLGAVWIASPVWAIIARWVAVLGGFDLVRVPFEERRALRF